MVDIWTDHVRRAQRSTATFATLSLLAFVAALGCSPAPRAGNGMNGFGATGGTGAIAPSSGTGGASVSAPMGTAGKGTGTGGASTVPSGTGGAAGLIGDAGPGSGSTMMGTGGMGPMGTGGAMMPPAAMHHDPGAGPWEVVPMSDVMSVCKLDPAKLMAAESTATYPWLIVRYGKLCYQHNAMTYTPGEAWSTTKTLGALVTGMVSYQTAMIPRAGKKTGPLSDEDRADQWLDAVTYNAEAKVAHVLGMVAHDTSLAFGQKSFAYDTVGTTEINSLGTMINAALAQDTARLGTSVSDFTSKFLYTPLGMKNSSWGGTVFAYSWTVDLLDMARVGLLINNYGMYDGKRLAAEQWIYRQTHPSFEDANTGFGYLTWLNSSSNWTSISGGKNQGAGTPGPCAPVAIHKSYPHGVSEAMDCGYTAPYTCAQKYDVGVWQAEGLGGQIIQGHRGLDMVIVARDAQPGGAGPGTAMQVWDALKGAVIGGDPMFKGDETAFCKAYGGNDYAPDL
jgi:hypothetical protein